MEHSVQTWGPQRRRDVGLDPEEGIGMLRERVWGCSEGPGVLRGWSTSLWGRTEGARSAQPGEGNAAGRPQCCLAVLTGSLYAGGRAVLQQPRPEQRESH